MSNVGCRIVDKINRSGSSLINEFKGLPVANVGDAMNRLAALDPSIEPMNDSKMIGLAFTVKVPEGDNLMFHKAMDMAKEGDVILIDAGGDTSRAILGELMAIYCQSRGIKGIVVDGAVRDKDVLKNLEIPVYAKAVSPNGPYKNGPGEINIPISIGGRVVNPGDIVIGDGDGIITIDPKTAASILEKVKKIQETEANVLKEINEKGTYTRKWVDKKLNEISCEYI
ncbi:methyltransferase [Shouchella clausii]|uniref:RraA family protein n=1 Tax=Shouchella clausii TaxID=79880 RepID=UPI001B2CAEE5|nr:RraA family protein [Shouchella clausii]GIN15723.1 methyltransferase [Shouchella clausii]